MAHWKGTESIKGDDGYARGAVVRVGEKGKKSLLLRRPV